MPCSGSECKPQVTGFGAMIYYDYDCVCVHHQSTRKNQYKPPYDFAYSQTSNNVVYVAFAKTLPNIVGSKHSYGPMGLWTLT